MTESLRVPRVLKAEMTESSGVPRVPEVEMTEFSRVPRVLTAEMTESLRVPRVPEAQMCESLRVPCSSMCNTRYDIPGTVAAVIDAFKCYLTFTVASRLMYPLYTFLGSRGVFDCANRMFISFRYIIFVYYVRAVPVSF